MLGLASAGCRLPTCRPEGASPSRSTTNHYRAGRWQKVVPAASGQLLWYPVTMSDAPKPQIDKFRDLAREIGADEDENRFEETVRRVIVVPPKDQSESESPAKPGKRS